MNKEEKKYRLLKPYDGPDGNLNEGTVHTEKKWLELFPSLSGLHNLTWFELVKEREIAISTYACFNRVEISFNELSVDDTGKIVKAKTRIAKVINEILNEPPK